MENMEEINVAAAIADDITDAIRWSFGVLFDVCAALDVDWKPYCATLMRDLADHVEL